jgi:energy-coupling factor transport system ATP-binding protein
MKSSSNAHSEWRFDILKEWLVIVGHNGSGKSTDGCFKWFAIPQHQGEITVCGIQLNEDSIWDIRKKLGMVFQNPDNQFVGTTVQDDVAFGLENHGIPRDDMIFRVEDSLKKVKMDQFLNQEPHHLSGGQKQRVAIAGVLALRPSIIILDEATSMLDPKGREEVLETVRTLKNEKSLTVISITHEEADAEEFCDESRVTVREPRGIFYYDELFI